MKKRILFTPTQWLSDLRYVDPLIKKINEKNNSSFFFFDDSDYERVIAELRRRNLPLKIYPCSGFQSDKYEDEIESKLDVESLTKGKLYVWPGLYSMLGFTTNQQIKKVYKNAKRKREIFRNILQEEKPDYLVVRDGQPLDEKWMCQDAKEHGVCVVALPSYLDQLILIPYIFSSLYDFSLVDIICVMGERCREVLRTLGAPDEKIKVTGSPMFSNVNLTERCDKERLTTELDRFGFSQDRYKDGIIVLALQGYKEGALLLNELTGMMEKYPHKLLIAKGHPIVTSRLRYALSRKRRAKNVLLTMDLDLKIVIPHSELLITMDSVTAFDAIRADIPVLISSLSSCFYFFDFIDDGSVFKIHRQDEIVPAVERLLLDEELKEELRCGRQKTLHAFEPSTQISPVDAIASLFET